MHERFYISFIVKRLTYNLTCQVLLTPGYILEDDCNNEARGLRETGREFYDGKYEDHFNSLFNSIGKWFKAMGDGSRFSRSRYLTNCIAQPEIWRRLGSTDKGFVIRQRGESNIQEQDIRKVFLVKIVDMAKIYAV